jgi:predicted DCC family thiol-disulfide oxidoreductase YuxK
VATASSQLPLVDPSQRPEADVIIFDGQCRFCRAQVARLARWDKRGRLAFISLHDPRVAQWYPDLTHDALMEDMYLIDRQGRRHRGAAALRYLSRKLWPLCLVAPLLHIPGSLPLWQWGYRQVARRRYLGGRIDECSEGACGLHWTRKR